MSRFKSVVVLAIVCSCISAPLVAQSASVEKQLREISSKLEKNQKKIQQKERAKKRAQVDLGKVQKELRYTELKLKRARTRLASTQRKIKQTKIRMVALEKTFEAKQAGFVKRIRAIYKQGYMGWLGLLFSPQEVRGLEDTSYYFERLVKEDIKMIKSLQKSHSDLISQKQSLEKETQRQRRIRAEIAKQEERLEQKKRQKSRHIQSLSRQIARIEKQNKELERASNRLASFIRSSGDNNVYYGTGKFTRPVRGWISSRYGPRKHPISKRWRKHNGIDFAAPRGYRIRAADSGVVIVAGMKAMYRGYGKVTVIDHGKRKSDGRRVSTVYAHQSRILVKEGEFVKKGDEIGWVGSTGYSTGPHLHFEVREDGRPTDPMRYLR